MEQVHDTAAGAAVKLRVNVFPSAKNLPFFIGLPRGTFRARGLELDLQVTPNSERQRAGLAAGAFEIAHAAVDNAVALADVAGEDVVIVMGGDNGMNEFIVQPWVKSFADIRGKALLVDAPDTAYALLARKLLARNGLRDGRDYAVKPVGRGGLRLQAMLSDRDQAAAVLNLPFSILAVQSGCRSMGNLVDLLGPYQANGVFVKRAWALENSETLVSYLAAYIEALRAATHPANREQAIAALRRELGLEEETARRTYELLASPRTGFATDARFDLEGFRNALAVRAETEGSRNGGNPAKYLDLSYYERAMRRVEEAKNEK